MAEESNIAPPGVVQTNFLPVVFAAALFWVLATLLFIGVIDPYGVSPLKRPIHRVNEFKPKRTGIDRIIKPFEVWWQQPRTAFLGVSRTHQGLDPAVLDGTRFAPAYNSAIPWSSTKLNASHLEHYATLDRNLKYVFVELFIYKFTGGDEDPDSLTTWSQLASDWVAIHFSGTAAFAAVQTVAFNASGRTINEVGHILPNGHWVFPANDAPNPAFWFTEYVPMVLNTHLKEPLSLRPEVFEQLDRMVAFAKKSDIELHFIITPTFPWDEYRLRSLGYWPMVEAWMRRVSRYPNVVSFQQYNPMVDEPMSPRMTYWHEPIHFTPRLGELMQKALAGDAQWSHLMTPVTPDTVEAVLEARRKGLEQWTARNRDFAAEFERLKYAFGADRVIPKSDY